jgi:hypothetical protein
MNVVSISLLEKDFCLSEVAAECATCSGSAHLEQEMEVQKREFARIHLALESLNKTNPISGGAIQPTARLPARQ